jgi:hypothetical protein
MAGSLAQYAKDKPEKPLSEIRELVWAEVAEDRVSRDARRGKDMGEPKFKYRGEEFKALAEKYSHLFEKDSDGKILRGIEVEEGWRRIVAELLNKFEWIRKTYKKSPNCQNPDDAVITIWVIKQKYTELRCHVIHLPDDSWVKMQVDMAIDYADGQAKLTCELCGRIGNRDGMAPEPTKISWQRVVCDACKEPWLKKLTEMAATNPKLFKRMVEDGYIEGAKKGYS